MKLRTVHVREFKSVWDSNPFKVDRVACLVGKNEAGKTVILQALYRLNPIVESDSELDVTDDYPRSEVENYLQDIESQRRKHAQVITATFELEVHELEAVNSEYGEGVLKKPKSLLLRVTLETSRRNVLYTSPFLLTRLLSSRTLSKASISPTGSRAKRSNT